MTDAEDIFSTNVTNMVVAVDDAAVSSVVEEQSSSAATTKRNTTLVRQRKASSSSSSSNARNVRFTDHFTLRVPTSDVLYKGGSVHIYDLRTSQIQISRLPQRCDSAAAVSSTAAATGQNEVGVDVEEQEMEAMHILDDPEEEDDDNGSSNFVELELRDIAADRACGLSILRLTYTVMGIFFLGILFVFSFLVILFLFMDLVVDLGLSGDEGANALKFSGTLFAIPTLIIGLSSLLTVGSFFVSQLWEGHVFVKKVGRFDDVVVESVTLTMLLGMPLFTMMIALFAKSSHWWQATFYAWFSSVSVYFVAFALVVVIYETEAAWLISKELRKKDHRKAGGDAISSQLWNFFSDSVHRKQNSLFSGRYVSIDLKGVSTKDNLQPSQACWVRFITSVTLSKLCCGCFEKVDPPERIYSVEDLFDKRQIITKHNWSMEQILCSDRRRLDVATVRGPSSLSEEQVVASLVCLVVTILSLILLVTSALVWAESGVGTIIIMIAIVICSCFPRMKGARRFVKVYRHLKRESNDRPESATLGKTRPEDGVYQNFETYRVTQPSTSLRMVLFFGNICLFYIYPSIALAVIGNWALFATFIVMAIWAAIRHWLDPSILLRDLGSFDVIGRSEKGNKWRVRSRVSTILMNVTRSKGTAVWTWILLFCLLSIFALTIGSLGGGGTETKNPDDDSWDSQGGSDKSYWPPMNLTPIGHFSYQPLPNLQYPTCRLFKDLELPGGELTGLADYAFLATLIYQAPDTIQDTLDGWFGPGIATLDEQYVADFRETVPGGSADVDYAVVSFGETPDRPPVVVVIVRGSTSPWEWLTNCQLWAAVGFMQVVTYMLPLGEFFYPILPGLLNAMRFVQSYSLQQVALYKQTTGLVNFIRNDFAFNGTMSITGQSLGGGIALISGAQTNIPAIAFSGPNNFWSRKTFDPPLNEDTINSMLFNVIPQRDIVPIIDKHGLLTQDIACRAKVNDLFGCHTATRTLCEIIYKCGTFERPPLCECATKYGYPPADQIGGNQTFDQICGTQRSNDGWYA